MKPYKKAFSIKKEEEEKRLDYVAWLYGFYNHQAFQVPIAHLASGLSRKSCDAVYFDKPVSQGGSVSSKKNVPMSGDMSNLPEEEKMRRVDMLFSSLDVIGKNFELSKKEKEKAEGSGE